MRWGSPCQGALELFLNFFAEHQRLPEPGWVRPVCWHTTLPLAPSGTLQFQSPPDTPEYPPGGGHRVDRSGVELDLVGVDHLVGVRLGVGGSGSGPCGACLLLGGVPLHEAGLEPLDLRAVDRVAPPLARQGVAGVLRARVGAEELAQVLRGGADLLGELGGGEGRSGHSDHPFKVVDASCPLRASIAFLFIALLYAMRGGMSRRGGGKINFFLARAPP